MGPLRIVLTGGGTGGHIFPLIAVSRQLRAMSPTVDLRFIGPKAFGVDALQSEGIYVSGIIAGKLPRYLTPALLIEIIKIPIGFVMALWRLYWYMPDVVFGKGGYGMLPVAVAAWLYHIPIVIHESDAAAGLATKIVSRIAAKTFTSFPKTRGLNHASPSFVGNPVRATLAQGDASRAQEKFGLAMQNVILVLGGSQGAEEINALMLRIAPELVQQAEVIHQVGRANVDAFTQELQLILKPYPDSLPFYHVLGFLDEETLSDAYAVATVAIARAGSSIISELAQAGIATIFVPLIGQAQNHQYANAEAVGSENAALVLAGKELTPHLLLDQVKWLLDDTEKRQGFSVNIKAFAHPDAAALLAKAVLDEATRAPRIK